MWVVIVDMRGNNGRACGIVADENGQWLEAFPTWTDAAVLKMRHPLGVFPWQVVHLDPPFEVETLPPGRA